MAHRICHISNQILSTQAKSRGRFFLNHFFLVKGIPKQLCYQFHHHHYYLLLRQ